MEQRLLCVKYQESAMTRMERLREPFSQPLDEDYFKRRLKQGWRPVAIHWEREVEGAPPDQPPWIEDVPFGLRVADDCVHLEEDPVERRAIELMLSLSRAINRCRKSLRTSIGKVSVHVTAAPGLKPPCLTCCRDWSRQHPKSGGWTINRGKRMIEKREQ